jgi:hypothetical protein
MGLASMGSRADYAWRAAATCAALAQTAHMPDERELYIGMRDAWISLANRGAFLDTLDEQGMAAQAMAQAKRAAPG